MKKNILINKADFIIQICENILSGNSSLANSSILPIENLEVLYEEGYNFWNHGEIDKATTNFAFLLAQHPYDRRFHFAFACALQHYGEYRHALTFFGYAAAMQANDPYALLHIASCLIALHEIDAARDALDACILLCYGQAHENKCYGDLCNSAKAILNGIS